MENWDNECGELVISRGLVPALLPGPLYPRLVEWVLASGRGGPAVIEQLRVAGHRHQAEALQVRHGPSCALIS